MNVIVSTLTVLKKFLFFFVAGVMTISSFSPPARVMPESFNKNTGEYFLPDYGNTLIAAHRLGKGNAPENTLRAIKACINSKTRIDTLEMDLQLTKDGKLVLFHDLYLDDLSDSQEVFGKKNVTVFSKNYDDLRKLNMGAKYKKDGKYPYADLHGDKVPDDLKIVTAEEVFNYVEKHAPGRFSYVVEIKYPHPWMPQMIKELYRILSEKNLCDRVIVGSFWNDTSHYIDNHYAGKLQRSANPFEIVDFYGSFTRNEKLRPESIKFMALQMPYYWEKGKLLFLGNLGRTEFIEYAHRYGISVQYWTVDREDDARELYIGGADMLMTDHPERIEKVLKENKPLLKQINK